MKAKEAKLSLSAFDAQYLDGYDSIIGIDEVGRGALAGPVVAGGIWLQAEFYRSTEFIETLSLVKDSKKLSYDQREALFEVFVQWQESGLIRWRAGSASVLEIEERNILGAT